MCLRVPMLSMTRAHSFPLCAYVGCQSIKRKFAHHVPMFPITRAQRDVIAWFTRVPNYLPPCAKVATARYHHPQRCPSHSASVCQVMHVKEPLCVYISHRKVPLCAYVAHPHVPPCAKGGYRMVHPCAKLPAFVCQVAMSRCHRVPSYPSQGAIVCKIAHRVACCQSQGAIMGKIYYVKVPSCGYVAYCVEPWEVIVWFPRVPGYPLLCPMLSIAWGAH